MKNKKITIFVDSCAWNILFKFNVNLAKESINDSFDWAMTKEVFSFEIESIPTEKENKKALKDYILEQIESARVREDSFFGFGDINEPEGYRPRVGGFGEGRFISYEESEQLLKYERVKEKQMRTGLYKDEADSSLALRATTGSVVLTAENPNKNGPLKDARLAGGMFINISEFDPAKSSFGKFIIDKLKSQLNRNLK